MRRTACARAPWTHCATTGCRQRSSARLARTNHRAGAAESARHTSDGIARIRASLWHSWIPGLARIRSRRRCRAPPTARHLSRCRSCQTHCRVGTKLGFSTLYGCSTSLTMGPKRLEPPTRGRVAEPDFNDDAAPVHIGRWRRRPSGHVVPASEWAYPPSHVRAHACDVARGVSPPKEGARCRKGMLPLRAVGRPEGPYQRHTSPSLVSLGRPEGGPAQPRSSSRCSRRGWPPSGPPSVRLPGRQWGGRPDSPRRSSWAGAWRRLATLRFGTCQARVVADRLGPSEPPCDEVRLPPPSVARRSTGEALGFPDRGGAEGGVDESRASFASSPLLGLCSGRPAGPARVRNSCRCVRRPEWGPRRLRRGATGSPGARLSPCVFVRGSRPL